MSLLSEIWSVLTPQQRRRVVLAQILSIVMAASTVAGIASIAPFFSVLGNPRLIDQSAALHRFYEGLHFATPRSFEVTLGVAFMSLVLIANLINVVGSFALSRLALWIGADLQSTLLREYLARPYIFYSGAHRTLLANNVIRETARSTNEVLQNIFALISNLATGGLIIASVVMLNPRVAASLILLLAGGYLAIYLVVRRRLHDAGETQSYVFAAQGKVIDETFGAIKEILVLHVQDFYRAIFERHSQALARSGARIELIAKSPRHIMECIAVSGLVLTALLAGARDAGAGTWLGELTFLGFAAYRLLPTMQQAFASLVTIRSDQAAFKAIAPDLRLARARQYHRDPAADHAWQRRPSREIRLEQVSFRYDPARCDAVRQVTMRIGRGTAVGIVGANGSGKSTLVDLIAGLLVPTCGRIAVDGIVIDDSNRAHWQLNIAYVPQTVSLMDTTIEENIALGHSVEDIDHERLVEAARLAQLDKIVDTLPGGYRHVVGEQGIRLSGGQRQRIGIARALYRNASVLIMDEATSAQDGLSEQELMTTLLRLRGRYTIVLIAHRLSSARACDTIFEFDRGAIVASGTYGELLEASTTFRRLAGVH
jgi:ABC-type multidrug transport system fused ATPase/permease subunit